MSTSTTDAIVKSLKQAFDDRARREADVKPSRVVGRNTDGSTLLLGLDGECISRGGSSGYSGEIVVALPALINRDGTVGVSPQTQRSNAALLWVDSITPDVFALGASFEVDVVGHGFTTTTVFEFLLPASEDVHPGIDINSTTFTDSEHVTLNVTVAADAELVSEAPLAFDDPARRF